MNPIQIQQARQLLGLSQTALATAIGWTTKRNVVSLEHDTKPKPCTVQTALSIECLLRRAQLWDRFVEINWFAGLSERNQDGLTRLNLFDIDAVEALVNDTNYMFPPGCNLANRSKVEIATHIAAFRQK
jgi:DNA-binding XRE family transcriptional regulator